MTNRTKGTKITTRTDGRIESQIAAAKEEAGRVRLTEIEAEIESAGVELGARVVVHERARDDRDAALRRYRRALGRHRQILAGKAV